jgi:putative FmdB family regulatory protein
MPIFDYECAKCGEIFEVVVVGEEEGPLCVRCGSKETRKIMTAPAMHVKEDRATARIGKRVKDYLMDGKVSEAVRFADKAASMVKTDKVKRIAEKLHQKAGR